MVSGKENIDIVFRNGLKDFEATPPYDIWEDIKPSLQKKPVTSSTWKVAASLAVLLSLGVVSYRLGMNSALRIIETGSESLVDVISEPDPSSPFIAFDNETSSHGTIFDERLFTTVIEDYEKPVVAVDFNNEIKREGVFSISVSNPEVFEEANRSFFTGDIRTYSIEEMNEMVYEMEMTGVAGNEEKTKRWSIAALVSPTYLSGQGKNNQPLLAMNERQTISYAGGVSFAFEISDRISVQSGLYYSSVGQQISGISAYAGFTAYNMAKGLPAFKVATKSGTITTDNADIFLSDEMGNRISSDYSADNFDPVKSDLSMLGTSLRQNFRYLELPLIVRYKMIDGDLGFNLIGGVSSNILVGNNVYLNDGGVKYNVGSTEGLRDYIVSSTLGMGMEYSISNSVSLNIEPVVRYYITPVSNSGNGINPFTFGLFSGISYKF